MDEAEWRAVVTRYVAAVEQFERVTRALTAALMNRSFFGDDVRHLMAAETDARELVIATRLRLIKLWRESLDQTVPLPVVRLGDHADLA